MCQALIEVHDLNPAHYIRILGDNFLEHGLFFKMFILRAYSSEAEHLSVRYTCFTVLGMAAVHAEKLVPVRGFDM